MPFIRHARALILGATAALALLDALPAHADIKIGKVTSHNPGIYLEAAGFEALEDNEYDVWETALNFVVSTGAPDGKPPDDEASGFLLRGAFCSYLVTDWFGVPEAKIDAPFDFSTWPEDTQLANTKDFLTRYYEAEEETVTGSVEEDPEGEVSCSPPWTQKRVRKIYKGMKSKEQAQVLLGVHAKYPPGTLIYVSDGKHAMGIRILTGGADGQFAYYDPNHGQAVKIPRDAADSFVTNGHLFLVARPGK